MGSKIIFVLSATIVVYLIFAFTQTKRLISIGNELANAAVPFSRETDSDQNFLVIGDSSAVGTGASKPKDSIAGRLAADYPDVNVTNLGVNGSKTHELIPRLQDLGGTHFDFMLIQIGGNDIVRRTNLDELAQSIDSVLKEAKKHADSMVLMTSGNVDTSKLLPAGTRWTFTKRTRQVREIFIAAGEENKVPYVDIFREKEEDPYASEPEKYYSSDIFHPSSAGYADWYTFVRDTLEKHPIDI